VRELTRFGFEQRVVRRRRRRGILCGLVHGSSPEVRREHRMRPRVDLDILGFP
jgi:hypothetical protein